MMSSVTCTRRFCAVGMSLVRCVGYSIMRSDDMQAFRNLARLVCIPRRDPVSTRRDPVHNRCCMYSRDRSRRT